MSDQSFPIDYFVRTVVCLLDTIQYKDTNYTHEHRLQNLEYVYSEAVRHFAQPCVNDALKVEPKKLEAFLRTVTRMVVYSWVKTSPTQMAALTIYYTYFAILNDSKDNPYPAMDAFCDDMINGRQQRHPWWRLVNKHLPNVLKHYGPFCAFNIYRNTLDCKLSRSSVDFLFFALPSDRFCFPTR
jgi:trichodiene synthase